jgi:hypothetical protein
VHVTISNQANHLLICTLNSGRTVHLAPAEISESIDHLEINGNQKIHKLVRAGLVSIIANDLEAKPIAPATRRQRKERG